MKINQPHIVLFQLSRWQKRLIMMAADLVLIPLAVWASFAMRLESWAPPLGDGVWLLFFAPILSIPVFIRLGLYRAVVRFLGSQALIAVIIGISVSVITLYLIAALLDFKGIPRSVYIIYWGTALLFIGGSRHLIRRLYHWSNNRTNRINVVIYGAGESGVQLVQALSNSPQYRPVLFLDDDKTLQKSFVHGLKVYTPSDLPNLIERYQLRQLLLAMPSVEQTLRRDILAHLEALPIHIRTIPGMSDLVSGASIEELQEIEIDDLLGRNAVAPDQGLLSLCIHNKNVMVTGAGGSIGSELCRQIVRQKPCKVVLFDVSEFSLYQIERELLGLCKHEKLMSEIIPVLGSVQSQQRVEEIISEHQVQTLYHAAAYKHVPMVECNSIEGVQNNTLGTFRTGFAAQQLKVERFVLISTDKAVRPTNVMGASKRMAELALQALAQIPSETTFSMVRFGNVLGSSGSVVPLFRKQIKIGGPITVTHPDIIRYFMTIPEAAQLVIQAGAMAKGGEVFLLDMGKPVKIVDLAKRIIRLSGLKEQTEQYPEGDISIEYTGLRPGEKLYEELLIEGNASKTAHPRIFHAHEDKLSWKKYQKALYDLTNACNQRDIEGMYEILETYVVGLTLNSHTLEQ